MTYRYWPLFDLRLSTQDLRLRPMTEADLAPRSLAAACPGDDHPAGRPFYGESPR